MSSKPSQDLRASLKEELQLKKQIKAARLKLDALEARVNASLARKIQKWVT